MSVLILIFILSSVFMLFFITKFRIVITIGVKELKLIVK